MCLLQKHCAGMAKQCDNEKLVCALVLMLDSIRILQRLLFFLTAFSFSAPLLGVSNNLSFKLKDSRKYLLFCSVSFDRHATLSQ